MKIWKMNGENGDICLTIRTRLVLTANNLRKIDLYVIRSQTFRLKVFYADQT